MLRLILYSAALTTSFTATSQFSNQQLLSSYINHPMGVFSADIDNDGDNDIVSASEDDHKIAWYENLGAIGFSQQKVIDNNSQAAMSVYATDADGDGDLDVFAASMEDHTIAWFENLDGHNFGPKQILSNNLTFASCVSGADLDGDGDNDILATGKLTSRVVWFENFGNGTFSGEQIISNNALHSSFVYSEDFDGDGDYDVVSASELDDKIAWYENLGGGVFGPEIIITTDAEFANAVYAMDLDGDADIDIMAASDSTIAWYENDGLGNFSIEHILTDTTSGVSSVYAVDIDGDGDNDIIGTSYYAPFGTVFWFQNLGGGNFSGITAFPVTGGGAGEIIAADLNGDAQPDLIIPFRNSNRITWQVNLGAGNFGPENELTSQMDEATSVRTLDVDNDGLKDVISCASGPKRLVWYKNLGAGKFGNYNVIDDAVFYVRALQVSDFDGDGKEDITCSANGQVLWYKNLGNGTFDNAQSLTTLINAHRDIACGDFDNDLDDDLLIGALGGDSLFWIENLGAGSFGPPQLISSAILQGQSVQIADLNGDGFKDAVVASYTGDHISWFENLGNGSFGTIQTVTTLVNGPQQIRTADIDDDGDVDILSASVFDTKIAWYENDGTGLYPTEHIVATTGMGLAVNLDDLDGDGDLDILTGSMTPNQLSWHENLGGGAFGPEQIITTLVERIGIIHTDDVDNDGDPDIFTASYNDDKIAWHQNYLFSPFQIRGKLFFDANQNGQQEPSEVGLPLLQVNSAPNANYAYTYSNGQYLLNVHEDSLGWYTISPEILNGWTITTDSLNYTVNITNQTPVYDSLDFGFYPDSTTNRIETSLVGAFPECNSTINYWINVANTGATTPSGNIHLHLHDSLTFVAASQTPDSIIGQHIYWSYDTLDFFSVHQINLQVTTPNFNSMGDTLTSILISTVDSSGTTVFIAQDTLLPVLVCAYDPNDKSASPAGTDSLGFIAPSVSQLEYLVRFQNTGTSTATNVVIEDQLDPNLDWSSVELIGSSHPFNFDSDPSGLITFSFDSMNLPDSSTNFLGSQGYIEFSVNILPGLPNGTSIHNSANIFFDSNPPVTTNEKINTLFDCTSWLNDLTFTQSMCQGNAFNASLPSTPGNNQTIWQIDTTVLEGASVTWSANASGVLPVLVSISNGLCSQDSLFDLIVYPSYDSLVHSEFICEGDSLFYLGTYFYTDTILYSEFQSINGCDSSVLWMLTVNLNPDLVLVSSPTDTTCINSALMPLPLYTISNGSYSGNGVTGNQFDPSVAGVGLHSINYTVTDSLGCSSESTTSIFVDACLGLLELENNQLLVLPNPFTSETEIIFPAAVSGKLVVKDLFGRTVIEKSLHGETFVQLNAKEIGTGQFIVYLMDESQGLILYKANIISL